MVRQIFKNKVIAAAGPLPGQLTVQNLQQWTKIRQGTFLTKIDDHVTHLLCSREQYQKDVPKDLRRRRGLHIVHYDWFEFSTVAEKKLPEREYSMTNHMAQERAKAREQARKEKAKRDAEKFVNTEMFHVYRDDFFFPYQVDITRDDEVKGEKGQRYTLCIWESNAWPHLYWFTAKFMRKKGDSQPVYLRESPCSGMLKDEMARFKRFFKQKTDVDWDDRVTRQMTTSPDKFQYTPPAGGKPVGWLPYSLDYCLEINAQVRGLPWPPVEGSEARGPAEATLGLPTPTSSVPKELMPTANSPANNNQPCECDALGHPVLPLSPEGFRVKEARGRLPEKETSTLSLSLENGNSGTESPEPHNHQPPSPQTGEPSKDTDVQPSHPSSSFRSGSISSPSSGTHADQWSLGLAIDSERLGYAINRALRIPAISSLQNDDEVNNTSVSQTQREALPMSFGFS